MADDVVFFNMTIDSSTYVLPNLTIGFFCVRVVGVASPPPPAPPASTRPPPPLRLLLLVFFLGADPWRLFFFFFCFFRGGGGVEPAAGYQGLSPGGHAPPHLALRQLQRGVPLDGLRGSGLPRAGVRGALHPQGRGGDHAAAV